MERFDHVGSQHECLPQSANRLFRAVERDQRRTELVVGISKLRIELNCPREMVVSGSQIAVGLERDTQSELVSGVAGVENSGALAMCDSLLETPELGQSDAKIEMRRGMIGAEPECGRQLSFRGCIGGLSQQCQTESEMSLC